MTRIRPKVFLGLVIVFSLAVLYLLIHIGYWYFSTSNSTELMSTIQEEEVVGVEVTRPLVTNLQSTPPTPEDPFADLLVIPEAETPQEFPFVEVDFTDLKERNTDIVAWLKMESVGLDIPLVQTTDNEFYLDKDLDKKKNKLGWVFFDTRSNVEHLGMNTVLYGHNAASTQMFGGLKKILKTDPDRKTKDEIIQVTTPTKEMVFEVVSVYVTDYDDWHYVNHVFVGDEDKKAFLDRMREKNEMEIFDKSDLSIHDKFLTFSTCHGPSGTTKRLVIHSRLVAER